MQVNKYSKNTSSSINGRKCDVKCKSTEGMHMMDAGRLKNICGLMCLKMRHSGGLCGTGSNGLQFALILISAKACNGAAFLVQFLHELEFSWCSSPNKTESLWILQTRAGSFVCLMFSGRCCSQHPKFSTTVQDWVMIQRNKARWLLTIRLLYRTVGGTVTKHVTLRASKVIC